MSIAGLVSDQPEYEKLLDRDIDWALLEGSRHFERRSRVFHTLFDVSRRLVEYGIPHAFLGSLALFHFGLRRFTENVDLLVTADDRERILRALGGGGYYRPSNSNCLRDSDYGVKINLPATGEFPWNNPRCGIAFPDPLSCRVEISGIWCVNIPTWINLKLASGMLGTTRLRDLADVMELIKTVILPINFSEQLHPSVRNKYLELWDGAQFPDPHVDG